MNRPSFGKSLSRRNVLSSLAVIPAVALLAACSDSGEEAKAADVKPADPAAPAKPATPAAAQVPEAQGTVDMAANWWNDENESNLLRMARKNMAKAEDFRIIYKSDLIVNSPMAYLSDLPDDLKAKIRDAVLNLATKDKAAFDKIYEGKQGPLVAVDNKAYDPVIELITFVDKLRKKKSS